MPKASRKTHLIAPLTPNSFDADAREDANNPSLMTALEGARLDGKQPGGRMSESALRRERAFTEEEVAEARATLDAMESGPMRSRRRASGPRPTVPNGKVLLRLPLSVHRELIERAEAEHTSLNQLVLAYVSRGLGQDSGVSHR